MNSSIILFTYSWELTEFYVLINLFFSTDFAYGHPSGFNPFMLNAGWLDAAYMNYAWTDYFRHQHQPHHSLGKGKHLFDCIQKNTKIS